MSSSSRKRPHESAQAGPRVQDPRGPRDNDLKTLRVRPLYGQVLPPSITTDVIQHQVGAFAETLVLDKDPGGAFIDVEFQSRSDAVHTLRNISIYQLKYYIGWSVHNLIHPGREIGRGNVTYKKIYPDKHTKCEVPSVPLPCNNPYPTLWVRPRPPPGAPPDFPRPNPERLPPPEVNLGIALPFPPFIDRPQEQWPFWS